MRAHHAAGPSGDVSGRLLWYPGAVGGAPAVFVHGCFNEIPPGISYSAGEPDTKLIGIQGAVRAGRSLEVNQKLTKRIVASGSEITGPAKQVPGTPGNRSRHSSAFPAESAA